MQQSIYNIIPKQFSTPQKEPLYKSKYPYDIPPTGSTFNHKTTSKPGVGNLNGQFNVGLQVHTQYGATKTMGHSNGNQKLSPNHYLKKHTGTMGNQTLPPVRNFSYDCKHKKQPVPCVHDKPVLNMKSGRNFIVTNAIENIIANARKNPESFDWKKKKNYGKTPEYLEKVKENIKNQYKMIQNINQQHTVNKICLTDDEVNHLREGLKLKWNQINKQYQALTHIRIFDTIGLKGKKQKRQKELKQIQNQIKKLNKLYIFVE